MLRVLRPGGVFLVREHALDEAGALLPMLDCAHMVRWEGRGAEGRGLHVACLCLSRGAHVRCHATAPLRAVQVFNAVTRASLAAEQRERRHFRPLAHWRAILRGAGFVDSYVYEMQVREGAAGAQAAAGVAALAGWLPLCRRRPPHLMPDCSPPSLHARPQPHDPTVDVMMAFFKPPSDALTQQQQQQMAVSPALPPPTGAAAAVHQLAAASSTAALHGGRSLLGAVLALLPQARAALQQVRRWSGPDSRAFPPPSTLLSPVH